MKNNVQYAYMCGIDWQEEIGHDYCKIFASVEDLKKEKPCWKECGIVKVAINLNSWVIEQDLYKKE
jgi:hypothetical protein